MSQMFSRATSFNGDISEWDVSSVIQMKYMFFEAKVFDRDISKWDVSSVINMNRLFWDAVSFKHELCGPAWVRSKAIKKDIFTGSSGSISRTVCTWTPTLDITLATRQHVTRRPLPDRELIHSPTTTPAVTLTIATAMTCPKCGTFAKSGRISCCAPGGAWFKNCGGSGNRNVDHKWSDGVDACQCKLNVCCM